MMALEIRGFRRSYTNRVGDDCARTLIIASR
jgi:hypothetical protein